MAANPSNWSTALGAAMRGSKRSNIWAGAMAVTGAATGNDGLVDQAIQLAGSLLRDELPRAIGLRVIAASLAQASSGPRAGVWESMLKVARGIQDRDARADALEAIAAGMALQATKRQDNGMLDQAVALGEAIEEPQAKGSALEAIALTLSQAGDPERAAAIFEQALAAAESVEDECVKVELEWEIMSAEVQTGLTQEQRGRADRARSAGRRSSP